MGILRRICVAIEQIVPDGDTSERVVKSTIWAMGQNAVGRIIQFGMLVILARVIGPTEMGLIGITLLALNAVQRFLDFGLNPALVQHEGVEIDGYLDTKWLLEIGRGLLILLVLSTFAPYIAILFSEPRITHLVRGIAFSPLILGLRNPGIIYYRKELEYHKLSVYRISGEIVQFVIAVFFALLWENAWAFIVGFLSAGITRLLVSYLIHEYRPRPSFDLDVAVELINYGKWITGNSVLNFLHSKGDDIVVGWILTPATLGFYQYAYRFSNAPATEISEIVSGVMFPAFSNLQENATRLRSAFLKTVRLTSFVAFPVSFGIVIIAPKFVRIFFGSAWTPMIPVMQILGLYGLLRAIGKTFRAIWKAVGRPDYITKLSFLRVVLIAILIYPATTRFGIIGTAVVVTGVSILPMVFFDLHFVSKSLELDVKSILGELSYPFIASVGMAVGTWSLTYSIDSHPYVEFAFLLLAGVLLYVAIVILLEFCCDWGIKHDLKSVLVNVQR